MAFVLKKKDVSELTGETKEFEYGDTGLKLTLRALSDANFQKAMGMLYSVDQVKQQELLAKTLDDSFFDDIHPDEKSVHELTIRAFGKYVVADWNVEDEKGEKLEVNADNFSLLLLDMDDAADFFNWCMESSLAVKTAKDEAAQQLKKKPLKGTSGKKTTAA